MKLLFSCFIWSVLNAARAQSSFEAMQSYVGSTSDTLSPIFSDQPGPVGWTFQPLTDISVTDLGAWAYAMPSDGLLEIGLWSADGTLLASNTVTSRSSAVNQSLYAAITPVLLTAGQTYYIGAFSPAGAFGGVAVDPSDPPNGYATMSPEIQLGTVAYETNGGFIFLTLRWYRPGSAIVDPNFEYVTVPEPASLASLALGIFGSLVLLRRTRQI